MLRRSLALVPLLALCFLSGPGCKKEDDGGGGGGGAGGTKSAAQKPLTIWWFQWAPADGLQELSDDFTKETGTAVKVVQIPLVSYQTKTFLEFSNATASHPTEFDIIVGDSQWIGRGATEGLYVDLTDWLKTVVDLKSIHEHASRYLCEYPEGSGKWFAAPCETDAVGLAYRKDWFADPKEQAAFQAKYKRDLKVPNTWEEFRDVAEFFQRPDQKRFGCAFTTSRGYDGLTMGVQNLLWSFGGMWKAPDSNKVKGYLDTQGTVDAIEYFKKLMKLGPNGATQLDYPEPAEYFVNGSLAMCVNYFAFFPGISQKMGDKAGFAVVPGHGGKRIPSLDQGPGRAPGAREEVHRVVREERDAEEVDHEARRLHRQHRNPEERRLPQGDPVQRAVRRLDRHHAGLLERPLFQRAPERHPEVRRHGRRRTDGDEGGAGEAGRRVGADPEGGGAAEVGLSRSDEGRDLEFGCASDYECLAADRTLDRNHERSRTPVRVRDLVTVA
jgi:ABC-type glycerol-3-phosphate transport system substrate-binding protein